MMIYWRRVVYPCNFLLWSFLLDLRFVLPDLLLWLDQCLVSDALLIRINTKREFTIMLRLTSIEGFASVMRVGEVSTEECMSLAPKEGLDMSFTIF